MADQNENEGLIITLAIAAGAYFFVVKPIMDSLGVGSGSMSATLQAQLALPASADPFTYQFQPFIDFYNNNTPTIPAGASTGGFSLMNLFGPSATGTANSNPSMSDFFGYLKQNPGATSQWGFLNTADLSARAENLKAAIAVNPFNPLSASNQAAAMSALAGLSNQLQMAFIACYLWYNYQLDVLTYLQGSLTTPGLTPSNLDQLINQINSLPVNPS